MTVTIEGASTLSFQTNISALQTTKRKIREFKELAQGWHFGEGVPIEQSILDAGIALNREAIRLGFLETDAFPGINGEVMLTIYSDDHYLEFTLETDSNVTFYREKDDEEVAYQEGLSFQDAQERIRQLRIEKWMESDFLVEGTTTPERVDLPASRSRIQQEMVESQSLTQSVPFEPEEISVSIVDSITRVLRTIPQFSGGFQQRYYRAVSS